MILLDTHVLVRYTRDEGRLGRRALSTIDRAVAKDELFASASPCGGADQTQSGPRSVRADRCEAGNSVAARPSGRDRRRPTVARVALQEPEKLADASDNAV